MFNALIGMFKSSIEMLEWVIGLEGGGPIKIRAHISTPSCCMQLATPTTIQAWEGDEKLTELLLKHLEKFQKNVATKLSVCTHVLFQRER